MLRPLMCIFSNVTYLLLYLYEVYIYYSSYSTR